MASPPCAVQKVEPRTCGTMAKRLSLQYAMIFEICSVSVGCSARQLFPL